MALVIPNGDVGSYIEGAQVYIFFNTMTSAGVPITLGGTPAVKVYKDNTPASSDTTATITVDFDSVVGMHSVALDTALPLYTDGSKYTVVLTSGTVDGTGIAGTVLGTFGVQNSSAAPTVAQIDAQLSSTHGAGKWAEQGSGSVVWTYLVTDVITHNPIDGVSVNVTTDELGTNIIAQGVSNALGQVVFYLDPGTYYMWSYRSGYMFANPDTEVVP
jgi:hypothetical protein